MLRLLFTICKVHLMLVANPFSDEPDLHVAFFLPARNEAGTVARVLGQVPDTISVAGRRLAVRTLVVDDGSTDGTGDVARHAGAHVIRTPGLGLGAAVRIGLAHAVAAGAAAVSFCDADGEYDPADVADLVSPIIEGTADYVIGSRFLGGPRRMLLHRNIGNRLLTALVRVLTVRLRDGALTDGQSGYRALSAAAAAGADLVHDYNYAQVLTLDLLRKGFRYREVPITYSRREIGRTFVSLPTYLRRVLPAIWRVHRSVDEPLRVPTTPQVLR